MVSAKTINNSNAKVGRPKLDPNDITTKKTITMYQDDIIMLETLINRTIKLGLKDKGLSGTIRMALSALNNIDDTQFNNIYSQIK